MNVYLVNAEKIFHYIRGGKKLQTIAMKDKYLFCMKHSILHIMLKTSTLC